MPKVKSLRRLSLVYNRIEDIDLDAFDNLDELIILDLSYNKIAAISDDVFEVNPLELQV